jgi:hypothetical protein
MQLTANEWAKHYSDIIWIDDTPWELRNRLLIPVSLPHTIYNVNRSKIREAILKTNALLAYWTDDWDRKQSEWWWTCCDMKDYKLENIQNPTGRRGIRKGLESCSVNRIKPIDFTELTYNIYYESQLSYNIPTSEIISYNQYNERILKQSNYPGFELWGAFVNGKLASYAICLLIDNVVSFGSTKSDPEFHTFYPNNALFYHITNHYLSERGCSYITNGPRTILHSTTINDFLIRMGYKRVYGRLNIELSNKAKLLFTTGIGKGINSLSILGKFFPNQFAKINGFLKLVDISKTF